MNAAIVAATGLLVLIGWAADLPVLTRIWHGWVPMKPNVAVCLVLLGLGLWLLSTDLSRRLVRVVAVGVGALAVASLVEHAGLDLHIDRLLFDVREPTHTPGRMAALTAVALVLLAVGVLAAAGDHPRAAQAAGLGALAIGYVVVLGYLLDVHMLYAAGRFNSVSLPSSVATVVAAVGVLAVRPDCGLVGLLNRADAAGRLTRRVVPFLLVGAAALGALDVAAERAGVYRGPFGTALLALSVAAVGTGVVWRAAVVIARAENAREARAAELRALTERLRTQVMTLVETAPDAIVSVDKTGTIIAANTNAAQMFGYVAAELVGRPVDTLLPARLRSVHAVHRRRYGRSPQLRPMGGAGLDLVGCRGDGSEFPVTVSLTPLPGDGAVLATVRDLTEVRAAEAAAAESSHRFAAAFDDAPVGMLLVDLDDRVVQVNRSLASMLGAQPDRLVGQPLLTLLDPRDVDDDLAQRTDLLEGRIPGYQRELRLLDVDGEPVWTMISTSLVRDVAGAPAHLVLHVQDIRSRREFEGRLQYLADHDPLTGLFNRRRFEQELTQHLAEHARYGRDGALLLMDLDNFKYVNDTLGHSTGDALIRAVAAALRHRVREADILARLGGDEFAVLLPGADLAEARAVAAALLDQVRANGRVSTGALHARTTMSVGIAPFAGREQSSEALLAAADLAMYAAKDEGRDRAAVYDPAGPHLARTRAKFRWLDRIHSALEHDLLTLHGQPIVEIATGRVTQLELLLRMREMDSLVPPARFLYIAERHGLAPAIDRWVVRQAIGFAATLTDPDAPRVEVNLSADSLADPDLPGLIGDLLGEHRVPADRMVFEVTETAAIANIDTARAFVEQLTDLGCGFALDDFGAGFGSFYYLKYLPFDYLKIDGEFIRTLTTSRTDRLIVTSIVAAAHGLGKRTIAEYVGDADTLTLLGDLGVEFAQGYHLGRPAALAYPDVPAPRAAAQPGANRPSV